MTAGQQASLSSKPSMPYVKPASLSSIADAVLVDAQGKELVAKSLWKDHPVVFLLIRRPGCVLCRAEARRMWGLRDTFDELGVQPICLVHEWMKAEVNAFKPKFWGGEIFLDQNKDIYRALGSGTVRKGSWLKFFCGLACLVGKYKEAKAIAPDSEQNTNGTHMIMGGLMVVRKGNKGIESMFSEQFFGDHPPYDQVLADCSHASGVKLDGVVGIPARASM